MRVLHTSDWHLGQKLLNLDRWEEQKKALDWLIDTLVNEKIDALIVSGDIFDTYNPPNAALNLYYDFLVGLKRTPVQHVLVTGGNHDSPSLLEAPKSLLKALGIEVIGATPPNLADAVLEWRDGKGQLVAIVAAVPFLRDRDLVFAQSGESSLERVEKVRHALVQHFENLGALCQPYKDQEIPVLTTGHLFAYGAKTEEKQDNIYIGDKANIRVEQFPAIFDYVALGHIHRPQALGGLDHIRYSGSLIPLSFSEVLDNKEVVIIDFKAKDQPTIQTVQVPTFRRLKTLSGTFSEMKEKLESFALKHQGELTPWVEVLLAPEDLPADPDVQIRSMTENLALEVIKIKINRKEDFQEFFQTETDLADLDVMDVFEEKCRQASIDPDHLEALKSTFKELYENIEQAE